MSEQLPIHLVIYTTHPQDYVLCNQADGTIWRGTVDGGWVSEKNYALVEDRKSD